jgi:hypothetical protein
MEKVNSKISCFENYLEIEPENGWKDNSIYEILINNIKDVNGNFYSKKITLYTKLSPIFSDVNAVKSLLLDIDIPESTIIYNIREASKYANYVNGDDIDENNIPFAVSQFVKYRAAHECLLGFSVKESSQLGISGKVGDVQFNEKETNRDISKLLKEFAQEVQKWMDAIKGYDNEGRAKMQTTIKGYYGTRYYRPTAVMYDRGLSNE